MLFPCPGWPESHEVFQSDYSQRMLNANALFTDRPHVSLARETIDEISGFDTTFRSFGAFAYNVSQGYVDCMDSNARARSTAQRFGM